jgi:hypothetical protein
MVWKRTFNKPKPKYRISRKPDYYEKKAERQRTYEPPKSTIPVQPPTIPATPKAPIKLKIIALHREQDVIVSFN